MCALCSSDPKEKQMARDSELMHADLLERMAHLLRDLASGRVKPHSEDCKKRSTAKSLIRYLVEEWM